VLVGFVLDLNGPSVRRGRAAGGRRGRIAGGAPLLVELQFNLRAITDDEYVRFEKQHEAIERSPLGLRHWCSAKAAAGGSDDLEVDRHHGLVLEVVTVEDVPAAVAVEGA
jgi:hypothetical protein